MTVEPDPAAETLLRSLSRADESLAETIAGADPASPSIRHLAARRADLAALAAEIAAWRAAGAEAGRLSALRAAVQNLVTEVTAHELSLKVNHGEA